MDYDSEKSNEEVQETETSTGSKLEYIQSLWGKRSEKIPVSSLSAKHKIFLGILLNCNAHRSHKRSDIILTLLDPNNRGKYQVEDALTLVLSELISYDIIYLLTDIKDEQLAFFSDDGLEIKEFIGLRFVLNVKDDSSLSLKAISEGSFHLSKEEFLDCWKWISKVRIMQFIHLKVKRASFPESVVNNMNDVVDKMLLKQSVSACKYFLRKQFAVELERINRGISFKNITKNFAKNILNHYNTLEENKYEIAISSQIPCTDRVTDYTTIDSYVLIKCLKIGQLGDIRSFDDAASVYTEYQEEWYTNYEE